MSDDVSSAPAPTTAILTANDPVLPDRKRPENIHRDTWNKVGRGKSVKEMWAAGLPKHLKCLHCNTRKGLAVWIRTYSPLAEFAKAVGPVGILEYKRKHGGVLPLYETTFGTMVFLAEAAACVSCAPSAERAAAEHPSYYLVEVRKAPKDADKIVVGYGG